MKAYGWESHTAEWNALCTAQSILVWPETAGEQIREFAIRFMEKGGVRDRRKAAALLLELLKLQGRLQAQVDELRGGKPVSVDIESDEARPWGLRGVDADGQTYRGGSSPGGDLDKVRAAIDQHCGIRSDSRNGKWTMSGPPEAIERARTAYRNLNRAQQGAYNRGLEDGRNLLAGLARGTLSVTAYNAAGEEP